MFYFNYLRYFLFNCKYTKTQKIPYHGVLFNPVPYLVFTIPNVQISPNASICWELQLRGAIRLIAVTLHACVCGGSGRLPRFINAGLEPWPSLVPPIIPNVSCANDQQRAYHHILAG